MGDVNPHFSSTGKEENPAPTGKGGVRRTSGFIRALSGQDWSLPAQPFGQGLEQRRETAAVTPFLCWKRKKNMLMGETLSKGYKDC